jgi:ABC-type multidrug transport system ATPase subunit
MSFTVSWHTLLEELDDLPDSATLVTPLSHDRFHVPDVQKQRVFIARALASEVDLLALDKPTVGVDAESREEF